MFQKKLKSLVFGIFFIAGMGGMSGLLFFSTNKSTGKIPENKNNNYEESYKEVQQRVNYLYNSRRTYKVIGHFKIRVKNKTMKPLVEISSMYIL